MAIEKTLVIMKPDTVQRSIVGEILTRFEKVGLKIIGMKMTQPTADFIEKHYHDVLERHGEKILNGLKSYMGSGPVIVFVLEGESAIKLVRKMIGSTEPHSSAPGTIRGDYAHMTYGRADSEDNDIKSVYNIIHASANESDAKLEINLWFSESELWSYKTLHEVFM